MASGPYTPPTSSPLVSGLASEVESSVGTGLVPGSALSISVVAVEFAKKGHLS